MGRSAGTVTLRFEAGTAGFVADVTKAKAAVRDFGSGVKASGVQASATIRALEGNVEHSHLALAHFLEGTLHLGPALSAAFNVVGPVLLGVAIGETAAKAVKFFKDLATAPARAAGAFREMNAPLRMTNDELAVANARLENDIAKLEGRRENTLKIALLEAAAAADKLADSLDKDIANVEKVMKEHEVGFWKNLIGEARTDDVRKLLGGESGYGGLRGAVAAVTDEISAKLGKATTAAEKDALSAELNARLQVLYQAALDQVNAKLKEKPGPSFLGGVATAFAGAAPGATPEAMAMVRSNAPTEDMAQRTQELQTAAKVLREMMTRSSLEATKTADEAKKGALEGARQAAALGRPFEDRMKDVGVQLETLRAKLEAVGKPEAAQGVIKGFAEANKAIEEVNKQLERISPKLKLTPAQVGKITVAYAIEKPQLELETQWAEKVDTATRSIEQQLLAQQQLTAAIGAGFAATRRAAVETQVLAKAGLRDYLDPSKAAGTERLRAAATAEYDSKRAEGSAAAVYSLGQEIALQNRLTEAQKLGEEEIRRIGASEIWRKGIEQGLTLRQIALEIQLYYAKQKTQEATEVEKTERQTSAVKALSAAQLEGAEAARRQALASKYAEMGFTGHRAKIPAVQAKDEAEWQAAITKQIAARLNQYRNEADQLDRERDAILAIVAGHKATVDQARALRDLQMQRLSLYAQEQLAIGTLRSGMRAFFADMEASAKRAGNILYEEMTTAVDRVSGELAKLMTGQKTSFGKMLQELGQETVKSSVKSMMQKGIGALGHALGIKGLEGKPDFTASKPGHVIVDNLAAGKGGVTSGAGSMTNVPITGGPSWLSGLFNLAGGFLKGFLSGRGDQGGGAGGGESVTSTISYPGMATGGYLSGAQDVIVGEEGPELLHRTSGYVTSNAELRRGLGGGGHTFNTSVDARGAELGVEQRVYRAVEAAHRSAVYTAVRASSERAKRVPQKSRVS
jgi:hypothetical protein